MAGTLSATETKERLEIGQRLAEDDLRILSTERRYFKAVKDAGVIASIDDLRADFEMIRDSYTSDFEKLRSFAVVLLLHIATGSHQTEPQTAIKALSELRQTVRYDSIAVNKQDIIRAEMDREVQGWLS